MTSNTLFSPDLSFDPSCSGLREIRELLIGLVPLCLISLLWTLSSQRPYSWSCVCSKGSSGSLFPWTWNPDLHFWNKIWIIDSWTPISFSSFSLKSIPGYGLFTNVMMRLCNWGSVAGTTVNILSFECSLQDDLCLGLFISPQVQVFSEIGAKLFDLKLNLDFKFFCVDFKSEHSVDKVFGWMLWWGFSIDLMWIWCCFAYASLLWSCWRVVLSHVGIESPEVLEEFSLWPGKSGRENYKE